MSKQSTNAAVSYGVISVIGRRRSMEDAISVVPSFVQESKPDPKELTGYDFFAVYDGHGASTVVQRCKERLHHIVAEEVRRGGVVDRCWESVMSGSYARMDDEVREEYGGVYGGDVEETVGFTAALVVLVGKEDIVVTNCGDSRVVLSRDGTALPISRDHQVKTEAKQSMAATGDNATDKEKSGSYVICTPEVSIHKRSKSDNFLIIASDGLWDVVTNQMACDIVRKCLSGEVVSKRALDGASGSSASASAAMLVELALARGSKDNISVIVVELQQLDGVSSSSTSA